MHIIPGLKHTSASLQLRRRLNWREDEIRTSLTPLTCGTVSLPLEERVILSTYKQIDIYSPYSAVSFDALEAFLSDIRGVNTVFIKPIPTRESTRDKAMGLIEVRVK